MLAELLNQTAIAPKSALVGVLFFFALFLLIIFWVIKLDKTYISKMENLPFEGETDHARNQR